MNQNSSVSDEEKLLYILSECSQSRRISGRKKLMKLLFFAEHYDPGSEELTPESHLESFDFEIFKYGPFSRKVLDKFDVLKRQGELREDSSRMQHIIEITPEGVQQSQEVEEKLSEEEKEHIQKIVEEFSESTGSTLEKRSLDELGIEKREKSQYRGMDVSDIIRGQKPASSSIS